MTIKQAVVFTGLTEYTLRKGIAEGRYPHIRTSGPGRGRILIDIELLEQYLAQEALDSTHSAAASNEAIHYGTLRRVSE